MTPRTPKRLYSVLWSFEICSSSPALIERASASYGLFQHAQTGIGPPMRLNQSADQGKPPCATSPSSLGPDHRNESNHPALLDSLTKALGLSRRLYVTSVVDKAFSQEAHLSAMRANYTLCMLAVAW